MMTSPRFTQLESLTWPAQFIASACGHLSPLTQEAYSTDLQEFIRWYQVALKESFDPAHCSPADIRTYRDSMRSIKAVATINRRLVSIRKFFTWLVEERGLDRSPATRIQPLGRVVRNPVVLTPQRRNRLLWTVEKLGKGADYPMIMTLAHTGVREQELVNLNLGSVHPFQTDEGVRHELVVMGKGGKERTLPIAAALEDVLIPYFLQRTEATNKDPQAPLFISSRGTRYTTSAIRKKVKSYGKKADIPSLHPHMLRHTFATEAIEATGHDWKVVKELLGHASVKTTLDIYDHPSQERMQKGVEGGNP